jgi:hypothetical protein
MKLVLAVSSLSVLALAATPVASQELAQLKQVTVRVAVFQPSTVNLVIDREPVEARLVATVTAEGISVVPGPAQSAPRGPSPESVPVLAVNVVLQKAAEGEMAAFVELALEQDVCLLRRRDSCFNARTWNAGTVMVARSGSFSGALRDLVDEFLKHFVTDLRSQNPRPSSPQR